MNIPDPDKGYCCPTCGQLCKRYYRSFNSNMALSLIFLYKFRKHGFIKIEELMRINGYKRCGDASYLRHYKLIEAAEGKREDGSTRVGMYKITGMGIMFVEKNLTVKSKFVMYKGKCEGYEGREINIEDALGKKFNYSELMNGDYKMYTV